MGILGGNIEDDWEYIEVLDRELLSDEDKESSIYSQDIVMLDQASTSLEHPYHVKVILFYFFIILILFKLIIFFFINFKLIYQSQST